MKNLGINFYHFLPTHLSTILLRKHGLISKRYYQVVILFSRLFYPILVSIDYKKLEFTEKGINREDLFQLISYSYILEAEQAGLVFPSEDKVVDNEIGKLAGYGAQLKKWSIQIPGQAESYEDFVRRIESSEKVFIENLGKCLKGKTNTG